MKSLMARGSAWLFPSAPPERLAVFRIIVGFFAVIYLLIRGRAFLSLTTAHPTRFEPVGVLSALAGPVADGVLVGGYAIALIAGVAFVLGFGFRVCGPAFASLLLVLCTYRSSWGQILWLENLMVVHVLIVGFARSADALSWSPGGRRGARSRPRRDSRGGVEASEAYGVPIRLAALIAVASYLLAAVAKVRLGGISWVTSDSLQNHVAASVVRADLLDSPASPAGRWLISYGWVFPPLAAGSLLFEFAAPVALVGGRLRDVWVVCTWLMHISIAALMFVTFPYHVFPVAFAPFFDLERLVGTLRRVLSWRRPERRDAGRRRRAREGRC